MSRNNSVKILLFGAIFSFFFTSCFKDVDFGQAEDITLEPDLEVDLLFYELNETDFLDSETNEYTPVIRDTVRLEFLDDDYIQDGLVYAAFRFRHENRFPYSINSKIKFLDKNRRNQFSVNYSIPADSDSTVAIVDTTHIVQGNDINKVRRSIEMAVELEIIGAVKDPEGELDFQSKGLFRFEF